jgi:hypothetical protein
MHTHYIHILYIHIIYIHTCVYVCIYYKYYYIHVYMHAINGTVIINGRVRVLFIGTEFSILYTSLYPPAGAACPCAWCLSFFFSRKKRQTPNTHVLGVCIINGTFKTFGTLKRGEDREIKLRRALTIENTLL